MVTSEAAFAATEMPAARNCTAGTNGWRKQSGRR